MGYLIAGRLKESGFPVENKHPAILPINHHISALVLHKIHLELKHSGRNHILSKLREKCRQHKKVGEQKMSSLSEDHVTSDESPEKVSIILDLLKLRRCGFIFTSLVVLCIWR